MVVIHQLCLFALAVLLVVGAVGDARRFIIPNRLCLAIAALALPFWLSSGADLWPMLAWQAGFAALAFAMFIGLFAMGVMGGGDVKLFGALALWLPVGPYLQMLVVTAVAGGLLTAGLLFHHRLRAREGRPEIPYGVAIAAGTLMVISQPIVKHLAG